MDKIDAYAQFLATFSLSSFAGLAALLRSGQKLSYRAVISAMLNSGLMGLVIFMTWYNLYGPENMWFLMGVSILAGLGGNTAIDFILTLAKKLIEVKAGVAETTKENTDAKS